MSYCFNNPQLKMTYIVLTFFMSSASPAADKGADDVDDIEATATGDSIQYTDCVEADVSAAADCMSLPAHSLQKVIM